MRGNSRDSSGDVVYSAAEQRPDGENSKVPLGNVLISCAEEDKGGRALKFHWWGVLFSVTNYAIIILLRVYTMLDDLDLISRSQVYQNHKLQIVFRFWSTVVS